MIQLHVFPSPPEILNFSVPCMKLEVWLRLAKLPYEKKLLSDPRKAPKGKLPYIVDGADIVADSEFIIAHLSKKYEIDLDEHLSAEEKSVARAFERMLNEHFYFCLLYSRWIDPRGWPHTQRAAFGSLPAIMRGVLSSMIRAKIRRDIIGQGLGRHSAEDVYVRAAQDLQAVSDYLGDQPFFMGREPSTIDATVYAAIANALVTRFDSAIAPLAQQYPNLKAYCDRMQQRCFPEMKR